MENNNMPDYTFSPIGYIQTLREKKYEAPRQPDVGHQNITSVIELLPHCNYEQALDDIQGFERLWLLYVFHKNTHWKPKVRVPRGRTKRGVFATRAPYRPNNIGISCVRLLDIRGRHIIIADADILDGTPLLDIKPYIPYMDSFPLSRAGWVDELADVPVFNIQESPDVKIILDTCVSEDDSLLRMTIYDMLSNDPYPHPYRRIKYIDNNIFMLAVRYWRITYSIDENIITLQSIKREE
jgi:tRNA (adenine37-N6)-methyltransferase